MDLLARIEDCYLDENFHFGQLLSNMAPRPTSKVLTSEKSRLEVTLNEVSSRVSELILENQTAYIQETKRIADLQKSITESIKVCTSGRMYLNRLMNGAANNGLAIVEHYKLRDELLRSLEYLKGLDKLRNLILQLPEIDRKKQSSRKILISETCYPKKEFKAWIDMKHKLRVRLSNNDYTNCKFDTFITILKIVNKITQVANDCCCDSSLDLLKDLNVQAMSFFKSYHQSSIEELKMFLEQELWDELPVRSDFKLMQLKEFSFLRTVKSDIGKEVQEDLFDDLSDHEQVGDEIDIIYKPLSLDGLSLSSSDDEDNCSELNRLSVYEISASDSDDDVKNLDDSQKNNQSSKSTTSNNFHNYSIRSNGPVLTNSSLNVLRLFGRYIQMMIILKPISYEILLSIYSLLDYYTITVFNKFGPESDKKADDKTISPKLRSFIKSIRESLTGSNVDDSFSSTQTANISTKSDKVPNIASIIANDMKSQASKNSDISLKKSVAIESLIVLVNQLWNLQEFLESLIPSEMRPKLKVQFTQSDSSIPKFLKARADMESMI